MAARLLRTHRSPFQKHSLTSSPARKSADIPGRRCGSGIVRYGTQRDKHHAEYVLAYVPGGKSQKLRGDKLRT